MDARPLQSETTRQPGRRVPPRSVLLLGLLIAAAIVWARTTTWIGDNAAVNVLTLILGFLGCVTFGCWFVFFSGYRVWQRAALVLVALGGVGAFFLQYKIDHVSGELIPVFRARGAPAADALLEIPEPSSELRADLADRDPRDFPQFLGPNRNGRLAELAFDPDWAAQPPRPRWRQPIGAGWSSFSAVNGFAVTMEQRGDDELVTCYKIASGELVWTYGTKTRHSTVLGGTGPRSTPTVFGGKVYAVGATGRVCCLDGATGQVVWKDDLWTRYQISKEDDLATLGWGRAGSPLIVDDLVVLPAGGPADGTKHSLIAYDRQTGDVAWESGDQQVGFSSPLLTTIAGVRQIVIINEESISGHSPADGEQLWIHSWPGDNTSEPNVSQPIVIEGDRLLVSKGYFGGAALLQLRRSPAGEFSVEEVWRNPRVLKTKFTNGVLKRDHLYALSDGILECVEWETGKRAWKRGRYYHGQMLGIDDLLLVQAEHGEIVLVEASPSRPRELARFTALTGATANNPCLYGRLLLVRNTAEAACYELPEPRPGNPSVTHNFLTVDLASAGG